MRSFSFPVQLMPEEDGGYSVTCPVLPGCHSQGDTLEEALRNIREAIELTIEDMLREGEAIPDAQSSLTTTVTVEVLSRLPAVSGGAGAMRLPPGASERQPRPYALSR